MNEIKKGLIEVAGDLSESELHVKQAVLARKLPKKRWRPLPFLITAVLFIALATFFVTQFKPEIQTANVLDDVRYEYDLAVQQQMWDQDLDDNQKRQVYEKYVKRMGVVKLAESKGYSFTDDEYQAVLERMRPIMEHVEARKQLLTILDRADVTEKQYNEIILPKMIAYDISLQKLKEEWFEMFPKMNEPIANEYSLQQGELYINEHFTEQLTAFREKHQISHYENSQGGTKTGVVALLAKNMFYMIENKTSEQIIGMSEQEIYDTFSQEEASWYPNDSEIEIMIGDIVKVRSSLSAVDPRTHTQTVSLVESLEVIDRATTSKVIGIRLPKEAYAPLAELFEQVDWQKDVHVSMVNMPKYTVHAGNEAYSIWVNELGGAMQIIPHNEAKYAKLPQSLSKKIAEFLEPYVNSSN